MCVIHHSESGMNTIWSMMIKTSFIKWIMTLQKCWNSRVNKILSGRSICKYHKWFYNIIVWIIIRKKQMRERIEAYQELKHTAINCGIETTDIAIIIEYILANLEEKRALRPTLVEKKSRIQATAVISRLSRTNFKALEVLKNNISTLIAKKERIAIKRYNTFLDSLDMSDESRVLLGQFIDAPNKKIILIPSTPLVPKLWKFYCISIDNSRGFELPIVKKISAIIKFFKTDIKVSRAIKQHITILEDTHLIRRQMEQEAVSTIQ